MSPELTEWIEATARRRYERLRGVPFAPGLVDPRCANQGAARRAAAAVLVTLVGGRPAAVHFRPGESYANLEDLVVNVDGALVEPAALASVDFLELLFGVAVHEGGHLYDSRILYSTIPVRRWIYNVVEDERIEVATARRWPALAPLLATTRRELIRPEHARGFLGALFLLVRAPAKLPFLTWGLQRRRLLRAMRILTPFPDTHAAVLRAVRRLALLVPDEERRKPPSFPCLELRGRKRPGRGRGDLRRGHHGASASGADAWSSDVCEVRWDQADVDAAGYADAALSARADALVLRAALIAAVKPRWRPMATLGLVDRRRLHAWQYDDRIFRTAAPTPREVTIVLILDLSGSMRSWWSELRRVAVAFSEAACGLRHVRLFVYGHAADGDGEPRTEVTRFATPARGPVLGLGTLPPGANNRDGHALDLIAGDMRARAARNSGARIAIHLCDNEPAAHAYGGLPARRATETAMERFARSFGPLLTLVFGGSRKEEGTDRRVVRWREQGAMRELASSIVCHL